MTTPARPSWAAHLPVGVEPATVDLLAGGSLPAAWTAHWRVVPARAVLRDPGGRWWDGGELDARTATVAGRLAAAGVRPGDRVLLSGRSSIELVVAHVAALRAGFVVVPMNTAYRPREIAHVVGDARPVVALVDDDEARAAVRATDPAIVVVSPGVERPDGPVPPLDRAGPDDPALIGYTSGTTAAALTLAWRWSADDRLILCLPLFHMHGLGVGLHGTLLAGASAVIHDGFELDAVLGAAADEGLGCTMFFGVPTMYARLAEAPAVAALGRLRLCVSGSAPLPAELHARLEAATGQRVLERYGMTETVMLVSNPYEGERRAGSVGLPLLGVELRLGERDEIEVRGPNVFAGYWGRPDATAEAFRPDGWFRTGDVGELDPDGYVRIVGRTKELVISGGFNVYPREVEDVVRSWPGVLDVAVVGTPSAEWGEIVTAYVEATDPVDVDGLLAAAAAELAPFKRPRIVHVVASLPRNSMGKIVRRELRPDDPSDAGGPAQGVTSG